MRRKLPFQTDAIVILPDHLHCIWQLPPEDDDFPDAGIDQRGETRPQGTHCDIGSFEVMAAPSPDLAVSKQDSPDPVVVTDQLTYTITVNNGGEGEATGVMLTDTLPSTVDFVSVSPSGSETVTGTVECTLGDLASGANATVTIVVKPTATGDYYQQRDGHQRRNR